MSKSTTRIIIFAILLLLVASLCFGFMVFKVISQGDKLSVQVDTLQASVAQEDSYYRLQRLSEDTTPDREQLKKYFLGSGSESIDFLNLVESIAPEAGVHLVTDSLDEISEKDNAVSWIQPAFTFSGSRAGVKNFIKILETLPYVLRLNTLEMTQLSSDVWEVKVSMQVRVLDS